MHTPFHTVDNKLHENQSQEKVQHKWVDQQTNACLNLPQLSLHPLPYETKHNNIFLKKKGVLQYLHILHKPYI